MPTASVYPPVTATALPLAAGPPQSGVTNVVLTSQDNASVNVLQLGVDAPSATLKDQHITSERPTDTGPGVGISIDPGHATGPNQNGGALRLADGIGTGTQPGGGIAFLLSPPGGSGSGQNIQTNRLALADVAGLTALYPFLANNAFLGLSGNQFWYGYINNIFAQSLAVKEGANAKQGVATLVAGTVVVANTSVTATSRIQLTCQSLGTVAVPSAYGISARVPGVSFTILASVPTDTSVIAYEIFEVGV